MRLGALQRWWIFPMPVTKVFCQCSSEVNLLATSADLLAEEFRPRFRLHCSTAFQSTLFRNHFSLHLPLQKPTVKESTGEKGIQKDISEFNFSQKLLSHRSVIFRGVSPCSKQQFWRLRRLLETLQGSVSQ